jgi:hypothetical protein
MIVQEAGEPTQLFRRGGWGLGGSDVESSKCVHPQQANCRDSVEGNGHPHTAQFRKLHSEMNVLEPKGRALGGHSFNSADTESTRIYPDLTAQKVLVLPLWEDPKNVLRNNAEVLLPKKNEVIVRPADLATASCLRRVDFPVQKFANYNYSA